MNKSTEKPIVIYHANCADGFGAAWVFHHLNPNEFIFHPGVYGEVPPKEILGRDVYLVDFSYKLPVVRKMVEVTRSITLIDHHKSSIEDLKELIENKSINSFTDVTQSGAMLAWKFFHPIEEPPKLLKYIEDRDLWKFSLPGSADVNAALFSYPYDFTVWDALMQHDIQELKKEGEHINRKHFKDIRELLSIVTRTMRIDGHTVPVANLPYVYSSDAGHILAKDQPFAACYWDTPTGRVFSLRSAETGMDVQEIAVKFGGGGHPHAAGFTLSFEDARKLEV